MSSILESLRKSDQKRKNKKTSGIDALRLGKDSNSGSGRKRLFFWLILLLVFAAVLFWSWRNGQLQEWLGINQENDVQAGTEITPTEETTKPSMAEVDASEQPVDRTRDQLVERPDPEEVKQNALEQRMQAAAERRQQDTQEVAIQPSAQPATSQPAPPVGVPEEFTEGTEESADEKIALLRKAQENLKKADTISNPQERQSRQETTAQAPTTTRNYKFVYELPFSIRKNLPEVKLNIHVFDPDPENRMAVINGLRYGTGDIIEEIVTVQDITQEGVLLEYEGQVFMIPK